MLPAPARVQAVPLAALKAFRERVSGLLQQAEQFKGLLGDTWLPRVGAAVCAAHYVEHQLQEPQGVLLLAELQDAAGAAGARPVAAAGDDEAAAAGGGGDAAAAAAAPRERSLVSLIEREANAFSALRKQVRGRAARPHAGCLGACPNTFVRPRPAAARPC